MELKDKILFNSEISDKIENSFEATTSPSEKFFISKNRNAYLQCLVSGTFLLGAQAESKAFENKIIQGEDNNVIEVVQLYNKNVNESLSYYLDQVNDLCLGDRKDKYEIIKDVLSFKSLTNNWDGFGAIPVEIESASNVINLIDLIGENEFCKVSELFPNPNGTISLIWNNKSGEMVSLDVGNKNMSYYVDLMSQKTLYFDNIEINHLEAKKVASFIEAL